MSHIVTSERTSRLPACFILTLWRYINLIIIIIIIISNSKEFKVNSAEHCSHCTKKTKHREKKYTPY